MRELNSNELYQHANTTAARAIASDRAGHPAMAKADRDDAATLRAKARAAELTRTVPK